MPYRAVAEQALERWRDARRRLETAPPDSPAWRQARADEELAMADYQAAVDAARRVHLPEPPPFSDAIEVVDGEAGT